MTKERYLERSFPIIQLNPLARRERNAFKPVYKMHKWFARRSASTFRAILLGAALPYENDDGTPVDLMKEFYESHVDDPRLRGDDGKPLRVLDPFMGGGTTVIEALRLGFEVTGIDYNPVAWFIVKGMTTPVDPKALEAAYERVAAKVKDKLLGLYKTRCPVTGDPDGADIIYAFWVKQGICVDPTCAAKTDLFKDYEVARKRGDCTLRYLADVPCPSCGQAFDWELERCTITAGGPQVLGAGAAGDRRPEGTAFAWGEMDDGVPCPHCSAHVRQADLHGLGKVKPKSKSVPLHVLIDPSTGDFFEVRGDVPGEVVSPVSALRFRPKDGPTAGGKFTCGACGRKQAIVEAAQARGKPLPFKYYGFYAYAPHAEAKQNEMRARALGLPTNNAKWFAKVGPEDLARVEAAEAELAECWDDLPLPDQEIYDGYNTNRLVIHRYGRWHELYGKRQLLALGLLAGAIAEEFDGRLRDALLAPFMITMGCMSNLARWNVALRKQHKINWSITPRRNP
jgi:putative DNA methylase